LWLQNSPQWDNHARHASANFALALLRLALTAMAQGAGWVLWLAW